LRPWPQTLVETPTETHWQIDRLFVTDQTDHIPHAIVDCSAMAAASEVCFHPAAQFWREIAFHVVNHGSANLLALDFYDLWIVRDHKVTLLLSGKMPFLPISDKTSSVKPSSHF
jgi:hypothetical protein